MDLGELAEYDAVQFCINSYCISDNPIIFFEVGAFDGTASRFFYSFLAVNERVDNRYIAFEPDSRNFNKILTNTDFPMNESGVEAVKKALYSKTGLFNLFCSSGLRDGNPNEYDCCSSLLEPNEVTTVFPFLKFNTKELVECITLDDFCKEKNIEHIDFIFADIQGAEGEMIKGGKEMMPKIKFMFLEKSVQKLYGDQPLENDLIEIMRENGFEVAKSFVYDILFYNTNLINS